MQTITANSDLTITGTGKVNNVTVEGAGANLDLQATSIGTILVNKEATGVQINIPSGTTVGTLNVNAPIAVTGTGIITTANLGASGTTIQTRPTTVDVTSGVTATVGGQATNSSNATVIVAVPTDSTPATPVSGGGGYTVPLTPIFISTTNSSIANDVATLGVVGTKATPTNTGIATAAITGGDIVITSVSEGKTTISVTDGASGSTAATIPVTVNADGSITLGTITKYVAATVTFKDPNLEHVIRIAINKSTGTIYKSDVENINDLDVSGCNIKDISGIENLANLQTLNLASNNITDISALSNLTNLQNLNLAYNTSIMNVIALSNLINLQNLNLEHDNINASDENTLAGCLPGCTISWP
ncbi:leucine-rich repeat domain-containing protein [Clostridium sp. WILCCON 0269]|uniref:Leucine-rich repeat domain-containing protein n=1 Tax=Candidatus Clostridium eludens TaxID=3381663 RepID=A0ABW8SRV3_9CLOT